MHLATVTIATPDGEVAEQIEVDDYDIDTQAGRGILGERVAEAVRLAQRMRENA